MKSLFVITLFFLAINSCKNSESKKPEVILKTATQEILNDEYVLNLPKANIERVLVLFGGYSEDANDIKREFGILDLAKKSGIAVILFNNNKKLWLEDNEKSKLAELLKSIYIRYDLPMSSTYFGGFSSGGNIAMLITDFLCQNSYSIAPKGVFAVDSPVDLAALYTSSEKNIENDFSNLSVQESKWIIDMLGEELGNPHIDISKYETHSIYTSVTNNIENLSNLKSTKIRFYTEPDTVWWKENRMAEYSQMNAFYLEQLHEKLLSSGFKNVEFIATRNKGYRASGERHPHSWSIIDKNELIEWMLK